MAMRWRRPKSVSNGQVWSRFEGRARGERAATKYQIRDMEERDRKQCLDLMQDTFIQDEPLCQILGFHRFADIALTCPMNSMSIIDNDHFSLDDSFDIKSDPISLATIRSNWEGYADQSICIACYTEVDGDAKELIGFNILIVKTTEDMDEDIEKVKGEPWKKLLKTLTEAENMVNVFNYYGVDTYLTSSGLAVVREHRGQNIGARLIEARQNICKAFGIRAACTVFTAKTSQVLAAKCGYQVLAELNYQDMLRHGIDLSGVDTPSAMVMGTKYY